MAIIHHPTREELLAVWRTRPADSIEHSLAVFVDAHTDPEVRDLLITIEDEDPPDSLPVACARLLWPALAVTA